MDSFLKEMLKDKLIHSKVGAKVFIFTLFILYIKGVDLGFDFKEEPSEEELDKILDNFVDYIFRDLSDDQKEFLFLLVEGF